MKTKRLSRILGSLLALCMVISMLPSVAYAASPLTHGGVIGGRGTSSDPYLVTTWDGLRQCLDPTARNEDNDPRISVKLAENIAATNCSQIYVGPNGSAGSTYDLDLAGHSINVTTSNNQFFVFKTEFLVWDSVGGGRIDANGCKNQVFYGSYDGDNSSSGQLMLQNITVVTDSRRVVYCDDSSGVSASYSKASWCTLHNVKLTAKESVLKDHSDYNSAGGIVSSAMRYQPCRIIGTCEFTTTTTDTNIPVLDLPETSIKAGISYPSNLNVAIPTGTYIRLNRSNSGLLVDDVDLTGNGNDLGILLDGSRTLFNATDNQKFTGNSMTFYYAQAKNLTVTNGDAYVKSVSSLATTTAYPYDVVTLEAKAPDSNSVFERWEVISGNVTLSNPNSTSCTFTMPYPAANVQVAARYRSTTPTLDSSALTVVNGMETLIPMTLGNVNSAVVTNVSANNDNFEIVKPANSVTLYKDVTNTSYAVRMKNGLNRGTYIGKVTITYLYGGKTYTKSLAVKGVVSTSTVDITMSPSTLTAGTPLNNYAFQIEATKVPEVTSVNWYRNGTPVSSADHPTALCGNTYRAYVTLSAPDGSRFTSDTTVNFNGSVVQLASISNNGKTATLWTTTFELAHSYGPPVEEGIKLIETCAVCGHQRERYNGNYLVVDIVLDSIAPMLGGETIPEITKTDEEGAVVQSVVWTKDGAPASVGDIIDPDATYYFTVTVGCKEGYSLVPEDHPNHIYSTLNMNRVDKEGSATINHEKNTITRTFSLPAKAKSSVSAVLPESLYAGMTLQEVANTASATLNGTDTMVNYRLTVTKQDGSTVLYQEDGTATQRTKLTRDLLQEMFGELMEQYGYTLEYVMEILGFTEETFHYVLAAGDTVTIEMSVPDVGTVRTSEMILRENGWTITEVNDGYEITTLCEVVAERTVTEKPVNPFVDVAESDWYYNAVLWAVNNKITAGMDETHFGPNGICTRAQAVTFLWNNAGKPTPGVTESPFSDVKPGDWYYNAVLWALEQGITAGMGDGTFGANQNCTRAQIVQFLYNADGKPAYSTTTSPFTDVKTGDWYYDAVLWAVEHEITAGMGDGTFGFNNHCTRAQIVQFLYNAAGKPSV